MTSRPVAPRARRMTLIAADAAEGAGGAVDAAGDELPRPPEGGFAFGQRTHDVSLYAIGGPFSGEPKATAGSIARMSHDPSHRLNALRGMPLAVAFGLPL